MVTGIGRITLVSFALVIVLCSSYKALAVERVLGLADLSVGDRRNVYYTQLLVAALENTRDEYGPYELIKPNRSMNSQRMMAELSKGKYLYVGVSPYKAAWQGKTLIVPVPLGRGVPSFRLFLAKTRLQTQLQNVKCPEHLKPFRFGLGQGWSTAKIMEDSGFNVVYAADHAGLHRMLLADRFELFMRGGEEIILEKPLFKGRSQDVYVVDNVGVFTYLPIYFHVAKTKPVLAKRLKVGLKALFESGEMDRILFSLHSKAIQLIQQPKRNFIYIENTNLPPGTFERDKPYLLETLRWDSVTRDAACEKPHKVQ